MTAAPKSANVQDAFDPAAIARAAELIRAGRLVAFPTETVYGLGANALDPAAVAEIFAAKGRPATNPLIVHVASVEAARELATIWPEVADRLAERFWPGPLTLVVEKNERVPNIVTAGGPTVGVRIPSHPAALALLNAAGVPVAAPSANRSEEVSPTTAQHVANSLGERVDLILDGGPTNVGIESTVLDATEAPPRILRPGMVTEAMIRDALRAIIRPLADHKRTAPARAPGQHARHYAPRKPLVVLGPDCLREQLRKNDGLLTYSKADVLWQGVHIVAMPDDALEYAARLYATLHDMDAAPNVERIVVELPPSPPAEWDGSEWSAVHDRLRRAAAREESNK